MYLNLKLHGFLVLLDDNTEYVQGSYSPSKDGRMVLSNEAWRTIVARNNLKINNVVVFLFHQVGEHFTLTKAINIYVDFCNARGDQLCVIQQLSLCISQALSNVMTKTCVRVIFCCFYCCIYICIISVFILK
jgi:hypothetical protein